MYEAGAYLNSDGELICQSSLRFKSRASALQSYIPKRLAIMSALTSRDASFTYISM